MAHVLNVYWKKEIVGILQLDEGRRFVFQYTPGWLKRENPMPLSIGLPLQAEAYNDDRARPFFANLLPESELRRIIARKLGLSEQNDFALLEAVGGECAGAISLLPQESEPKEDGNYCPLDDEQLNALIAELPKRPMLAGEEGIRLSLAGAQNKLPVYFNGNQISLPMGNAASSHILKPPIKQYEHTVENETFCMMLAARMDLPVPDVTILNKAEPLYLITRYDRQQHDPRDPQVQQSQITRLHQEDFCQALGVAPDMKYEKEGGPSLKACFELLRNNSIQPVADIRNLLNWVVFNYLIGNADAHAKNIALLFTNTGPQLAPFYDLMCTAAYEELTDRIAMKIGGEDRPNWIIERRWQQFAEEIDVGYKLVKQTLLDMSNKIVNEAKQLQQQFTEQYGECELLNNIINIIEARAGKVSNILDLKAQ